MKTKYINVENEYFSFLHYYTSTNDEDEKNKLLKKWENYLKNSGWTEEEFECECEKRLENK